MLARVISGSLNVRAAPDGSATVIGSLSKGAIVRLTGVHTAARWAEIEFGTGAAFVARRFLAQSPDAPLTPMPEEALSIVSRTLWEASRTYDAIAYRLGCKARRSGSRLVFSGTDVKGLPCSGATVDCSGWVSGLFQLAAAAVNEATDRAIFGNRALGRFANHSDGQISGIGEDAGQIYSGTDIDGLPLRSGLLFGLNTGDHDWEGGGRVFGIDHVVMGVQGPEGYYITQSSSSGGGVNVIPWPRWRTQFAASFDSFRVHCVDPLAMGAWTSAGVRRGDEGEEVDQLSAPPG